MVIDYFSFYSVGLLVDTLGCMALLVAGILGKGSTGKENKYAISKYFLFPSDFKF